MEGDNVVGADDSNDLEVWLDEEASLTTDSDFATDEEKGSDALPREWEPRIEQVERPGVLVIGFAKISKKKDLEQMILGVAEKTLHDIRSAWYGYRKFNGGYLYEVHGGGDGKGVLSSLIGVLEKQNAPVIIDTNGRKVRVVKSRLGIESFELNESDPSVATEGVEFKDDLSRLVSRGWGALVLGGIMAGTGMLLLFMAALFKFVIYDRVEGVFFDDTNKETPISQLAKIKEISLNPDVYVASVKYENGNWLIKTSKIKESALEVAPVEGESVTESMAKELEALLKGEE